MYKFNIEIETDGSYCIAKLKTNKDYCIDKVSLDSKKYVGVANYEGFKGVEYAVRNLFKDIYKDMSKKLDGEIICIESANNSEITVGKIYTFKGGMCKTNTGYDFTGYPVRDINELNDRYDFGERKYKFIKVVR